MLGAILGFIIRWQYVLMLGAAAAFIGGFYLKGRSDCAASQANKQLTETLRTKEKLDEIRNNRPDADAVVKRLRSGSF
jgi:hypothetical protein